MPALGFGLTLRSSPKPSASPSHQDVQQTATGGPKLIATNGPRILAKRSFIFSDSFREGAAMEFTDKELECVDCGAAFLFSAGEQMFFREKGFTSKPKAAKPVWPCGTAVNEEPFRRGPDAQLVAVTLWCRSYLIKTDPCYVGSVTRHRRSFQSVKLDSERELERQLHGTEK